MSISDLDEDVPDLVSDHSKVESRGRDKPTTLEAHEISKRGKRHKRLVVERGDKESKRDNGELDSDFEFMGGGKEDNVGVYDASGFEGARETIRSGRGGVDVDDIIRRRTGEAEEVEETDDEQEEVEFTGFVSDYEDLGLMGLGWVLWERIRVGRINLGLRRMRMETKRKRGRRKMGRGKMRTASPLLR